MSYLFYILDICMYYFWIELVFPVCPIFFWQVSDIFQPCIDLDFTLQSYFHIISFGNWHLSLFSVRFTMQHTWRKCWLKSVHIASHSHFLFDDLLNVFLLYSRSGLWFFSILTEISRLYFWYYIYLYFHFEKNDFSMHLRLCSVFCWHSNHSSDSSLY